MVLPASTIITLHDDTHFIKQWPDAPEMDAKSPTFFVEGNSNTTRRQWLHRAEGVKPFRECVFFG